jgi:1,4-alpha-glucan branching enzyme
MLKYTPARHGEIVKVTFALPIHGSAHPVSVVGDFNGWDPFAHPLKKRSNGTMSATVELAPGQALRFKYLADGGHWFCDPDSECVAHSDSDTVDSLLVV